MKKVICITIGVCFGFSLCAQSTVDKESYTPARSVKVQTQPVNNTHPEVGSSVPQKGEESISTPSKVNVEETGSSVYDTPIDIKSKRKKEIPQDQKK